MLKWLRSLHFHDWKQFGKAHRCTITTTHYGYGYPDFDSDEDCIIKIDRCTVCGKERGIKQFSNRVEAVDVSYLRGMYPKEFT